MKGHGERQKRRKCAYKEDARERPMVVEREKTKAMVEEKNVKIHRRYAAGGVAVNNETLHQHRDACGVFIA